jgi:hypothetical protein
MIHPQMTRGTRKRSSTSAITRPNITYKNDATTSPSHRR